MAVQVLILLIRFMGLNQISWLVEKPPAAEYYLCHLLQEGGYPLASVVSVFAIKVLVEEKLAENAILRGSQLLEHFNNLKSKFPDKIKEVRGKGLLTAFEMFDDPKLDGHKVSLELLKQNVYAKETHHSIIRIAPSLTINAVQIDQIAGAIQNVIGSL